MTNSSFAKILGGGWVAVALAFAPGCGGSPDERALEGGGGQGCAEVAGPEVQRQGALGTTDIPTDLALQGPGFFVLKVSERSDVRLYTREGRFTTDRDGYLINLSSMRVLGYAADGDGTLSSDLRPLQIGAQVLLPKPTSSVRVRANLQADAAAPTVSFDPANPAPTSNFSSSTTVYDSQGKAHQVDIYYVRTGTGTWDFHALTDGGGVQAASRAPTARSRRATFSSTLRGA